VDNRFPAMAQNFPFTANRNRKPNTASGISRRPARSRLWESQFNAGGLLRAPRTRLTDHPTRVIATAMTDIETTDLLKHQHDHDLQRRGVKIDDAIRGLTDEERMALINKSLRKGWFSAVGKLRQLTPEMITR
jgi:hypothetical protein